MSSNHLPELRAAIELGSGAVRIQMSLVDATLEQIVGTSILATCKAINLTEDVAKHHGIITEAMEQELLKVLSKFKEDALTLAKGQGHQTVNFIGIATAIYRTAKNANELLKRVGEKLKVRFQILSQDEEGELGFCTVRALYPTMPESSLVAWDSGNSSFQMTIKRDSRYHIYQGPLGNGSVRVILANEIRNGSILNPLDSGCPISRDESDLLQRKIIDRLPPIPEWLLQALSSKEAIVATFGEGESVFTIVGQAIQSLRGIKEPIAELIIVIADVRKVMDQFINLEEKTLQSRNLHHKTLTSAILLATIMQHFNLHQIQYKRCLGNTLGMLIDSHLWKKSPMPS